MTTENENQSKKALLLNRKYQFSLGTILLCIAVVGLVISNLMTHQELSKVKLELEAQRPIPPREVAKQFEKQTTISPMAVTVKDVRYSLDKDSYKIEFSFFNAKTKKTWTTDTELTTDGYGSYSGIIHSSEYYEPLGYKDGVHVGVKSPSPLLN